MQLKSLLWRNCAAGRGFKSLNDRQSRILLKFKEPKEPIQFHHMSINNCQTIQRLVYARLRERDFGFFRAVTVFKLLDDRQSELRESSEPIMYKISYNISTEKFQAIQKNFFIISMRICRIEVRSWHPSRDILSISCEAWRLLLAGNF